MDFRRDICDEMETQEITQIPSDGQLQNLDSESSQFGQPCGDPSSSTGLSTANNHHYQYGEDQEMAIACNENPLTEKRSLDSPDDYLRDQKMTIAQNKNPFRGKSSVKSYSESGIRELYNPTIGGENNTQNSSRFRDASESDGFQIFAEGLSQTHLIWYRRHIYSGMTCQEARIAIDEYRLPRSRKLRKKARKIEARKMRNAFKKQQIESSETTSRKKERKKARKARKALKKQQKKMIRASQEKDEALTSFSTPNINKLGNSTIKVAIMSKDCGWKGFEGNAFEQLEQAIINEIERGSKAELQLYGMFLKDEMFVVNCANRQTVDWLQQVVPKLSSWKGPELMTVLLADVINPLKNTVFCPKSIGEDIKSTCTSGEKPSIDEPSTNVVESYTAAIEPATTAVESSAVAEESSTAAIESFTAAIESSTTAVESTAVAEESFTAAIESFTASEEESTTAVESSAVAEESSTAAIESFTAAIESSTTAVESTAVAEESSTAAIESFTASEEESTTAVESSAVAEESSTAAIESFTASEEESTTAVESSAVAEESSTAAIESFTASEEESTTAVESSIIILVINASDQ